ncbi:MAG: hypothetical protein WDN75_14710 [Bacteroidota bacterium]
MFINLLPTGIPAVASGMEGGVIDGNERLDELLAKRLGSYKL